jgi:hypothetical protein
MSQRTRLRKALLIDTDSEEEQEDVKVVSQISSEEIQQTKKGVPDHIKKRLLTVLDTKGGLEVVSNSERVLAELCDTDPDSFGSPTKFRTPRNRRRQVSNFVDKFKRLDAEKRKVVRARIFQAQEPPAASSSISTIPEETPAPKKKSSTRPTTDTNTKKKAKMPSPYRNKTKSPVDEDGTLLLATTICFGCL